jgi:hypothetical protein
MHEHDLDLIAAAAAGDPDVDQDEAARLVAVCDQCHQEWEAQRMAIAALAAAPRPALDDLERARLHRGVSAALKTDQPDTRSAPTQVSPITRRILAVAGAAAVVVAVLGVGSLLRDGGGTVATLEQTSAEAGADPTAGDQSFETAADAATLQDEMQIPEASGGESTETTAAAAAAADTTNRTSSQLSAMRLAEVPRARLAAELLALRDGEIDPDIPTVETALSCLDQVGQDRPGAEIDLVAVLAVGGNQVEAYVLVDPAGERAALAYRASNCTLIAER